MGDLRPTQVKNMKIFQSDLIVMSDLPRWKIQLTWRKDLARDVWKGQ